MKVIPETRCVHENLKSTFCYPDSEPNGLVVVLTPECRVLRHVSSLVHIIQITSQPVFIHIT